MNKIKESVFQIKNIGQDYEKMKKSGKISEITEIISHLLEKSEISKSNLQIIFRHLIEEISLVKKDSKVFQNSQERLSENKTDQKSFSSSNLLNPNTIATEPNTQRKYVSPSGKRIMKQPYESSNKMTLSQSKGLIHLKNCNLDDLYNQNSIESIKFSSPIHKTSKIVRETLQKK